MSDGDGIMIGGRGRLGRSFIFRPTSDGGGGGFSDSLTAVLSVLASGVWSSNVLINTLASCKERKKSDSDFAAYYTASGQTTIGVPASEHPFSYSSGVYVPTWKAYYFTGGGHNDWCGSEVSKLTMSDLTWRRTDESAKLALSIGDETLPFQSGDTFGYRTWRNPSGRFAPISSHMYGGMAYMSHNDKIYVHGAAPFQSGTGGVGGSMWVDVSSGHWDEDGAYSGAPGAAADTVCLYMASCLVVTSVTGTVTGSVEPGIWRTFENRSGLLIDPDNKAHVGAVAYFGSLGERTCHGTIIPDPAYPVGSGWKAYVAHGDTAGKYAIMSRCNMKASTSASHANTVYGNFDVTAPAGTGGATWIYMGDYVPGCEKIAVWAPSTGLYALDISTSVFAWSSQIVSSPTSVSSYGIEPINKRFFFMPDYDAFGVFDGTASALYVLKRPAVFS